MATGFFFLQRMLLAHLVIVHLFKMKIDKNLKTLDESIPQYETAVKQSMFLLEGGRSRIKTSDMSVCRERPRWFLKWINKDTSIWHTTSHSTHTNTHVCEHARAYIWHTCKRTRKLHTHSHLQYPVNRGNRQVISPRSCAGWRGTFDCAQHSHDSGVVTLGLECFSPCLTSDGMALFLWRWKTASLARKELLLGQMPRGFECKSRKGK